MPGARRSDSRPGGGGEGDDRGCLPLAATRAADEICDAFYADCAAGFSPCLGFSRRAVVHDPGVREFLHAGKKIGASGSEADRSPGLGGRRLLVEMIRQYEMRFRRPEGVPATYDLLFARGERRSWRTCWVRQELAASGPN